MLERDVLPPRTPTSESSLSPETPTSESLPSQTLTIELSTAVELADHIPSCPASPKKPRPRASPVQISTADGAAPVVENGAPSSPTPSTFSSRLSTPPSSASPGISRVSLSLTPADSSPVPYPWVEDQFPRLRVIGHTDPSAVKLPAVNDAVYLLAREVFEEFPGISVSSPFDPEGYDFLTPSDLPRVLFLQREKFIHVSMIPLLKRLASLKRHDGTLRLPPYLYSPADRCFRCKEEGTPCMYADVPRPEDGKEGTISLPHCLACVARNEKNFECDHNIRPDGSRGFLVRVQPRVYKEDALHRRWEVDDVHVYPYGSNMISWDPEDMVDVSDLDDLEEDLEGLGDWPPEDDSST